MLVTIHSSCRLELLIVKKVALVNSSVGNGQKQFSPRKWERWRWADLRGSLTSRLASQLAY